MARRLVGDDFDAHRVIVVRRRSRINPDWPLAGVDSPHFLFDGPEYETAYGPYILSAARGQLSSHTRDAHGRPRPGVVGGRIERASVTWEVVT